MDLTRLEQQEQISGACPPDVYRPRSPFRLHADFTFLSDMNDMPKSGLVSFSNIRIVEYVVNPCRARSANFKTVHGFLSSKTPTWAHQHLQQSLPSLPSPMNDMCQYRAHTPRISYAPLEAFMVGAVCAELDVNAMVCMASH